jgi:hypothetical protein
MRPTLALLAGTLIRSLALAGCSNKKNDPTARNPTPNATPAATITAEQVFVSPQDLPAGCRLEQEGSIFQGFAGRSFDCGDVRLTLAVGRMKTEDEARVWQSDNWSTRDGVTDLIKRSLAARPTDPNSLRVQEVTDMLPKLGATEERIYCASFTDPSGAQRVTEYWGGYRHQSAVVQYTASALTTGACDNASRLPEIARSMAIAQLNKLRAAMK